MARLNRNNFLRFTGASTKRHFHISADLISATLFSNADSCSVYISDAISSELPIDTYSFEIQSITDLYDFPIEISRDCQYDPVLSILTIYRPIDLSLTAFRVVYKISDQSGNKGTNFVVAIEISPIIVSWVAYPASATCTLDSYGNNTGYKKWSQLKLINSSTLTDISPLTLKDNNPSDGDYIAPLIDLISCPTVGSLGYGYLFVSNYTKANSDPGNWITITNVLLYSATFGVGGTPITLSIPAIIDNGQTRKFYIPAGSWDNIAISYYSHGVMATATPLRFWLANNNGSVIGFGPSGAFPGDNPVDDSGILSGIGITIPTNSNGITIFAQ